MKKAIIVSGYFNPLHKGHIEYFLNAKKHGDRLFVIVNSDYQRKIKGSKEFMNEEERTFILNQLKIVDKTFISIDKDRSVCETIKIIHNKYSLKYDLYFANGGDQTNDLIPEKPICKKLNIKLIDNLGSKIQSSSWLLKQ
mgnify:FL=1|tara:strand:- start:22030 stop:22449 length:420 start_codon:yes stop_codon:yes gene_type:complete